MQRHNALLRVLWSGCLLLFACDEDAAQVRRTIREVHIPETKEILEREVREHRQGVTTAAERLAPGFLVEDPARREREMRVALKLLRRPPRGVPEFFATPMSFLAAIDRDGAVICRDQEPDPMRGQNFAERFPIVQSALTEGRSGYQLGEFTSPDGTEHSVSMLFVAPARRDGEIVGAVLAGIQLARMSKLFSEEMRVNHAEESAAGTVIWAFVYHQDRVFDFPGAPPEFFMPDETVIPTPEERRAGLTRSPGGFTGEGRLMSRTYGYAILPIPRIGEDTGVVIVRSEATR